jgi:hypothetical protein
MPLEQRAELSITVESALQYIAQRVAFQMAWIASEFATGCNSIQVFILAKEVIRIPVDVPNALHSRL